MPTNVAVYPQAVDPSTRPPFKTFGDSSRPAVWEAFSPFAPSGGEDLKADLRLGLPLSRLDDRRHLLAGLDRIGRWIDSAGLMAGVDSLRQQAFDTVIGGVADAFNLAKESPATLARYDTAPLVRPHHIDPKWHNHLLYEDNAKALGKLMLLSRRLCERGCGFVTVTTNFVWDMHADINNAGMEEGMRYLGLPFDHAISTFLDDVAERGLGDKILLVCCGEIGRTPQINFNGGRDHWGNLAPLLLAGGGLNRGHVIGQSTRDAGQPRRAGHHTAPRVDGAALGARRGRTPLCAAFPATAEGGDRRSDPRAGLSDRATSGSRRTARTRPQAISDCRTLCGNRQRVLLPNRPAADCGRRAT